MLTNKATEKAFDKIPFCYNKILLISLHNIISLKLGSGGSFHNTIKKIYEKPIASIILNGKVGSISTKIYNHPRLPMLTTAIQCSPDSTSQSPLGKKMKSQGYKSARKKSRHPCLHITWFFIYGNSSETLLELLWDFGKVTGYQVSIQKSIAIVYTKLQLRKYSWYQSYLQ